MTNKLLWFLALIFISSAGHSSQLLSEDTWLEAKNGRTSLLFKSFNKPDIQKFIPSGRDPENKTIEDYKITLYYPVFYSNSQNPDTSRDKPASVIVSYKNEVQFVGKGYKFSLIEKPATKHSPLFIIRHWSGTMGCSFTDVSFISGRAPLVEKRSSRTVTSDNKLGDTC